MIYQQEIVIKWARKIYCNWNWFSCTNAIRNGHLDVLIWAIKNCPEVSERVKEDMYWEAVCSGQLKIIKWLKING